MSGDSQPVGDCVTVRLNVDPEHGLGFNIRGGIDFPHVENDGGIFITKIRDHGAVADLKRSGVMEPGDRLLEINGQSLVNVTHGEAVQVFVKAKEEGRGTVQLKFVKGALDQLNARGNRRKTVQNKSRIGLIVRNTVTLAGMAGVCYLVYKYNVLDTVANSIKTRIKDFQAPIKAPTLSTQ